MKQSNFIGLILFSIVILFLLYNIFSLNSNLSIVEEKLDISQTILDSLSYELKSAEERIKNLKINLSTIKHKNERLILERDSLGQVYLNTKHQYEQYLNKIKRREVAFRNKIEQIRRENDLFK